MHQDLVEASIGDGGERRQGALAAVLLTVGDAERIRECDAESCTWLFLDGSRNRSRRWCDMASCGNRAKARRHYRRRKADDS